MILILRLALASLIAGALGFATGGYMATEWTKGKCDAERREAALAGYRTEFVRVEHQLERNQETGHAVEINRQKIHANFKKLDREASNDAPHAVDLCVLPAERLQRWRAANAGISSDTGAATRESHPSTADAAATGQR
ncbi:hypothetical protein [Collimonas antrihumi]|uniref:hypothetical protein n=1 Tax=Collimonas antrihumi TaxID=1940615 RepID=UPI001B8D79F5|nr:hypothetical protein [Collimonas antrihumi]